MSDLSFELHFGQDLTEADVLDWLQAAVGELSPSFAETIRVLEYDVTLLQPTLISRSPGRYTMRCSPKGPAAERPTTN